MSKRCTGAPGDAGLGRRVLNPMNPTAARKRAHGSQAFPPTGTGTGRRRPVEPGADVNPGLPSAAANSAALAKRSAGSFSSAWRTAASTLAGIVFRLALGGSGSPVSTLVTTDWAVGPVKGGAPTSISYVTEPSEYTSLRA